MIKRSGKWKKNHIKKSGVKSLNIQATVAYESSGHVFYSKSTFIPSPVPTPTQWFQREESEEPKNQKPKTKIFSGSVGAGLGIKVDFE